MADGNPFLKRLNDRIERAVKVMFARDTGPLCMGLTFVVSMMSTSVLDRAGVEHPVIGAIALMIGGGVLVCAVLTLAEGTELFRKRNSKDER